MTDKTQKKNEVDFMMELVKLWCEIEIRAYQESGNRNAELDMVKYLAAIERELG